MLCIYLTHLARRLANATSAHTQPSNISSTSTRQMPRRRWRHKYPFLYTTIRRTSTIRTIFACFTLFPTLLWLLLASQGSPLPSQLYDARRVLIVLAHPGDESLFFSPTILRLTGRPEQDKKTRLLVLSEGIYLIHALKRVCLSTMTYTCMRQVITTRKTT